MGKWILIVVLLVLGTAGLLVALCGGFFGVIALTSGDPYTRGAWFVELAAVIVGGLLAWVGFRFGLRQWRARRAGAARDPG